MTGRVFRVIAVAAMLPLAARARPVNAQATFSATQNLVFGQLTPGVAKHVLTTDVINHGEYHMNGEGTFNVLFVLPTVLQSTTTAATIPLTFSATDAAITFKGSTTSFNPATGTSIRLTHGQQDADIKLGGTASPTAGILAGTYTATITVYCIQTG
jgi:hypothetical protein